MNEEHENAEKIQNELQSEFEKYKADPSDFVSYIKTMNNIDKWLNEGVLNENS
jgi:sensor domain CHASE-containing protein